MRWGLVVIAACSAAPAPATPSNHTTAPQGPAQRIATLVIEEYGTCEAPAAHHVELRVDGELRGTITVPCREKPKPHNGVIVVTSDEEHEIAGPTLELAPGRHAIEARDVETTLHDQASQDFPYAIVTSSKSVKPPVTRPADVMVVTAHEDWLRVLLAVRDSLIFL
jgi:hypothetical protein